MRSKVKKVAGVGVNDNPYNVQEVTIKDGKRVVEVCPYYSRWSAMIRRCYSDKLKEKLPTYSDCSVCDEWIYFSKFKEWMISQDWKDKDLDKDLWVDGNRVYSPDTCMFIPVNVNRAIKMRSKSSRGIKIGLGKVKTSDSKYVSKIADRNSGYRYLGTFESQSEGHKAWQEAKILELSRVRDEQKDDRVVHGLNRIIGKLMFEVENNLETVKLDVISTTKNVDQK